MPTEVKLWELVDGQLKDVADASLADSRLEKDLEDWIVSNPSPLGDDFRDLSARDAVAQAPDYASWRARATTRGERPSSTSSAGADTAAAPPANTSAPSCAPSPVGARSP
jgi:hypothetical protein